MFFRRLFILFMLCSFAVGLIAFLVRPAQAAEDVCFAEYSGDGVTDFSSADASALRSAIFALPNGGVVKVAGTCAGTFDYGHGVKQVALVGLSLTLVGGYTITNWLTPDVASNVTVLDAQGDGRVLWAIAPITLSGLTLTGGNSGLDGGGALFQSAAIVADSTFTQNTTSGSGGGALFQSRAVLTNTVFSRNLATLSGGGALFAGETALTNTTFFSNTASGLGSGGAIFNGATTVANSAFIQNQGDSGGATFNNTATVASTIFRQNSGAYGGGASFNWFQGQEQHRLVNVLFAGNSASINGQAIYVQNTALLELIQTTIVSPTLVTGAPAIFLSQGTAALTNTIVASHTNGLENFGGVLSEDFNLFSNVTTPYAGTINSGGNSITGTVAFANPTDYTLTPASAAVDTGTNAGVNRDFFGTVRPQGAGFEIGYAEFTPPPPSVCFATTDNAVTLFAGPNASALRSAIAAASDGGMVKVAGTCAGAIAKDGTVQVAIITQTLTLAGGYTTTNWLTPNVTSNVTVLDAQGAGRVIFATAPVTVSGLTVTGGNSDENGGGAYFSAPAILSNSLFLQNSAANWGGGAYFLTLATLTSTSYISNTAFIGGGALFEETATLTNTAFTGNRATSTGGGVFFAGPATAINSSLTQNTSGSGGGAYFETADPYRLVNVLFAGNLASANGQAVYVFDTALLELIHTTIVSPTLVTGPAVYVNAGTVALTNTFVASHTVGLENAGGSVSENFNLFGNVTVPYSGTIISGGNSITGTAAFANYTDYTLTQAGAAIDKGTNAGVNRDFFGIARPQGAGFDIGYAEFVPIIFKLYLPIIGR